MTSYNFHRGFVRQSVEVDAGDVVWATVDDVRQANLKFDMQLKLCQNTAQDLERLLEIYQEDIGPRAAVVPEVQRWVNKWKEEDVSTVPWSAIVSLCACHADIYPNVYILLTI